MNAMSEKMTLRQWRVVKNFRVKELAQKTGLTERTINSYEHDIESLRRASYQNVETLATALGIRVGDIFLSPTSEKPKYDGDERQNCH